MLLEDGLHHDVVLPADIHRCPEDSPERFRKPRDVLHRAGFMDMVCHVTDLAFTFFR